MTKIPLRLQAFLHGAPKSQNSAILTDFCAKCTFWLQNAKKAFPAPKCSLGPSGLTYHAPIPEKTQESEGRFFRILYLKILFVKN